MKKFYANHIAIILHLIFCWFRRVFRPVRKSVEPDEGLSQTAFLFRTNKLTRVLQRNYELLEQAFPGQVFVIADESAMEFPDVGMRKLSLDSEWGMANHLRVDDSKPFWLNGDYFYYRALGISDQYSFFWLIDDDVVFNVKSLRQFFLGFAGSDADFIGAHVISRPFGWSYARRFRHIFRRPCRCFFPVSRSSRRAITALFQMRQSLSQRIPSGRWPNDEVFVASKLVEEGFDVKDLNDFSRVYSKASLSWKGRFQLEQFASIDPDELIYHSVK